MIVIVEEAVETVLKKIRMSPFIGRKKKNNGKMEKHGTYPAPYTKMLEESTTRRPQDLRHEALVQVEKVGSENVWDGVNGVKASGLDWKYL